MENPNTNIEQFSAEEFIKIADAVKPFWEKAEHQAQPQFVIFMGGIGSGKTTIRKKDYSIGYVNIDFAEIYSALEKAVGKSHERLSTYCAFGADLVLKESMLGKKNIVIEIIGDDYDLLAPIINKMKEMEYKISIQSILIEPDEAYKRHVKAVAEDLDYFSAYHSQEATLSCFYSYFGMPMPTKENTVE